MATSDTQRKTLVDRYIQLGWTYALFALATIVISAVSFGLQFLPEKVFSNDAFLKNSLALPDLAVTRVLFSAWCLMGLVAFWWRASWPLFSRMGAALEDAAIALLGAIFGLFAVTIASNGVSPLGTIVVATMCVFGASLLVRLWWADDVREFLLLRVLASLAAIAGIWTGLSYPNSWPF